MNILKFIERYFSCVKVDFYLFKPFSFKINIVAFKFIFNTYPLWNI